MARTKVPVELSSTPGITDSSNATAITIDSSEDVTLAGHLVFADSKNIKIGAGTDLQLYHDGTNSYLTNATGALKVATETSGIAVSIGHTTSETTVNDNLNVTGVISPTTHIDMPDSANIKLGTGDDLQLYHDGTNSYITNAVGALKIATETSGIAVTIGHGTSEVTVADNLTVTGDLTVSGTTTTVSSTVTTVADPLMELNTGAGSNANDLGFVFERGSTGDNAALIWDESADVFAVGTTTATGTSTGNMTFTAAGFTAAAITGTTGTFSGAVSGTTGTFSGVVDADAGVTIDNITIDGTEIDLSTGDLTLDVAGDIVLDADDGIIHFKDGGTTIGQISNSSSDLVITSSVQDNDIIFKGDDGGSAVTALTLDMSDAGTASFNHDIKLADNGIGIFGTGSDLQLYHDGTNSYIANSTGALKLATETSGIAITIGHTTSETTVADNLTVTGSITSTTASNTFGATSFNDAAITNVGDIALDSISSDAGTGTAITFGAGVAGSTETANKTGSVAPDFSQYTNFVWTLTGALTLTDPGDADTMPGLSGIFVFIQDGTGGRTLTHAVDEYLTAGGAAITLSTAANSIDIVPYFVQVDGKIHLGKVQLAFADA